MDDANYMMPKRKRVMLGCLISAVAASFVVGMAGTFAWFDARSKVDLDTNVAGQTEGSYFARGRGSQANPYIINKPRHLYNLA